MLILVACQQHHKHYSQVALIAESRFAIAGTMSMGIGQLLEKAIAPKEIEVGSRPSSDSGRADRRNQALLGYVIVLTPKSL